MKANAILDNAFAAFAPRPSIRLLDWAKQNIVTDNGSPFDAMAYPHHGAPGGPMDAIDCTGVSTVWMQWASRLGKTFVGQVAAMRQAACSPCPMMFASSDQKLAVEVTARTYRMIDKCEPLRNELRPPHRRKQDCIELVYCRQFVAWSRSVSTLADKAIQFGHASEVDKWERASTSKEADPLKLFTDRFKEFPVHKRIIESTPSVKGNSRIERGLLGSTNCRYYVPCPHCKRYQTLQMGDGENPGGIFWEKREGGKHDKELARTTAYYQCQHCHERIENEHRGRMMRMGVWCPEGCKVNDEWAELAASEWKQADQPKWKGWAESPWIEGTPLRDGRDAGYQLSSLYAVQLTWGDIAAEFVECKQRPVLMQNFVNQWKGETWEVRRTQTSWEILGQRCISRELPRGVVPLWASLVTVAVDRQQDRFPWIVEAWGPGQMSATIAYGETETIDQVYADVISKQWPHMDGGPSVPVSFTLVDTGYLPKGLYEFCRQCVQQGVNVWPCKGSNHALDSDYKMGILGPNTSMPGMRLYHVDTIRSQGWLSSQLEKLDPTEEGGWTLHAGSLGEHQDFLEQIVNDGVVDELDNSNNVRQSYNRIDTNIPNDFRDCKRYAYTGMLIFSGGRMPPRTNQTATAKRSAVINAGITRPNGRAWG